MRTQIISTAAVMALLLVAGAKSQEIAVPAVHTWQTPGETADISRVTVKVDPASFLARAAEHFELSRSSRTAIDSVGRCGLS